MVVLLQGISRQLFKTQCHKKADMSKVNGKFPNRFQLVQLFFSMPSCLPSFVSEDLRRERREARVVNDFKSQSHLNTVINLVKNHLVTKLSLLFGQRWQQFSK